MSLISLLIEFTYFESRSRPLYQVLLHPLLFSLSSTEQSLKREIDPLKEVVVTVGATEAIFASMQVLSVDGLMNSSIFVWTVGWDGAGGFIHHNPKGCAPSLGFMLLSWFVSTFQSV